MDAATEAYIARLVADAPPLSPEQAALIVRTFANKTPVTSSPVTEAA